MSKFEHPDSYIAASLNAELEALEHAHGGLAATAERQAQLAANRAAIHKDIALKIQKLRAALAVFDHNDSNCPDMQALVGGFKFVLRRAVDNTDLKELYGVIRRDEAGIPLDTKLSGASVDLNDEIPF